MFFSLNHVGLEGLRSLQELKVNNNDIKSLLPLKGLPCLKELDISNNSLRTLDGIKQLLALELLRAEHNDINTLKIVTKNNSSSSSKQAPNTNKSTEKGAIKSKDSDSKSVQGFGQKSTTNSFGTDKPKELSKIKVI